MSTITVTNNSSSSAVVGSLLWAIGQATAAVQPVLINFLDTVFTIDINGDPLSGDGSNKILAQRLTINGLHTDNVTRVQIRNVNSVPGVVGLFSANGTTSLSLQNLEFFAGGILPTVPIRFFSMIDLATVTVNNCLFRNNTAQALSIQGPLVSTNILVQFSTFNANSANIGGALTVSECTGQIADCQITNNTATGTAGGLFVSDIAVMLAVNRCNFVNNSATNAGSMGGAIFISGSRLGVFNSNFTGNSAVEGGGAIFSNGSILSLVTDNFDSNIAGYGGGIATSLGPLDARFCNFRNNNAIGPIFINRQGGGGLYSNGSALVILSSLFSGNSAFLATGGGGVSILNPPIDSAFFNVTFNGNSATGLAGGAIRTYGPGVGATLRFVNCTIDGNSSTIAGGGIATTLATLASYGNNIIAENTAPLDPDVSGTITSTGTNFVGIASPLNGFGGTDITGTLLAPIDPGLFPLANNGGFTFTMAIDPVGSPVIDAGNNAIYTIFDPVLNFDQRGQTPFARINPPGTIIDIGAFEFQQVVTCFRAGSKVLVRDISTGETHTLDIEKVTSDSHQVYDVTSDSFVPIVHNAVGGKTTEFYRLEANLFEDNVPSEDLDLTGQHLVLQGGQRTQASDIEGAIRIETEPELVYSIVTESERTILVNNTEVIAWASDKWDRFTKKTGASWVDNRL